MDRLPIARPIAGVTLGNAGRDPSVNLRLQPAHAFGAELDRFRKQTFLDFVVESSFRKPALRFCGGALENTQEAHLSCPVAKPPELGKGGR
jgi:hypothetical protein